MSDITGIFRENLKPLQLAGDLEDKIVLIFAGVLQDANKTNIAVRYIGKAPWNDDYLERTGMWQPGQVRMIPVDVAGRFLKRNLDVFEPAPASEATGFAIPVADVAGEERIAETDSFCSMVDQAVDAKTIADLAESNLVGWKRPKTLPKDVAAFAESVKTHAGAHGLNR